MSILPQYWMSLQESRWVSSCSLWISSCPAFLLAPFFGRLSRKAKDPNTSKQKLLFSVNPCITSQLYHRTVCHRTHRESSSCIAKKNLNTFCSSIIPLLFNFCLLLQVSVRCTVENRRSYFLLENGGQFAVLFVELCFSVNWTIPAILKLERLSLEMDCRWSVSHWYLHAIWRTIYGSCASVTMGLEGHISDHGALIVFILYQGWLWI